MKEDSMPVRRRASRTGLLLIAATIAGACTLAAGQAETAVAIPPPAYDPAPAAPGPATAVLAGGCFWGVQGVFQHVIGLTRVVSGYSGGAKPNPSYEDVSSETTGHAESVRITYDPSADSYGRLLQVFFSVAHNPTELDRQGPDEGPSYRSNIFYMDEAQRTVAQRYIAQLNEAASFPGPIVTRVDAFKAFYPAEAYHQDFLLDHPRYPYIVINDLPKIANFKAMLPSLYRAEPVRVSNGK
jgi:peptide-methionine (S)-S-oxide reductase